jgi:coenzyme F420-0:L-glutamate ligase/coenzyme F420-1:gamma-L-glutamate ligase
MAVRISPRRSKANDMRRLTLIGLTGIGDIRRGDDIGHVIAQALSRSGESLEPGDALIVAQKIVSKSEGRDIRLADVTPSQEALRLAEEADKDPRAMQLLLDETRMLLRVRRGVVVVEDDRGLVLANAGIDASNVSTDGETVLLLPVDPDASAAALRDNLGERTGVAPAVLIIDSIGRAWRQGTVGTAIGVSGMPALLDLRGRPDMFGRPLATSELGLADELAAAASLVMGQADERCPVVLARGLDFTGEGRASDLLRPRHMDMFR